MLTIRARQGKLPKIANWNAAEIAKADKSPLERGHPARMRRWKLQRQKKERAGCPRSRPRLISDEGKVTRCPPKKAPTIRAQQGKSTKATRWNAGILPAQRSRNCRGRNKRAVDSVSPVNFYLSLGEQATFCVCIARITPLAVRAKPGDKSTPALFSPLAVQVLQVLSTE